MRVPAYCRHRATGLAFVVVPPGRRFVYLGPWNSDESRRRYAAVVAALSAGEPVPDFAAASAPPATPLTVAELGERWLRRCEQYHTATDPLGTSEIRSQRVLVRDFVAVCGVGLAASAVAKSHFLAVRDAMISRGLSRGVVNARLGRLRRLLRWANDEGLVPDGVVAAAAAVRNLAAFRSAAPERPPVGPVDEAVVAATFAAAPPPVAAMIRLQLYTGCRPGEARLLRRRHVVLGGDGGFAAIDFGVEHKNGWRGRRRLLVLGPQSRQLLAPYVTFASDADAFLFRRLDGRHYSDAAYAHAIVAAARRAGVESWSPLQLRHTYGTLVRARYGLDAARSLLGHAGASTTEIYCERDESVVRRVAAELG